MREIKFRAWDKEESKMLANADYQLSFCLNLLGDIVGEDGSLFNPELTWDENSKRFVVMQYTGLKDRYKKEIWEGDILRALNLENGKYTKWIVTFQENVAGFVLRADYLYEETGDTRYLFQNLRYGIGRVIGNIYENSELLKIKKGGKDEKKKVQ